MSLVWFLWVCYAEALVFDPCKTFQVYPQTLVSPTIIARHETHINFLYILLYTCLYFALLPETWQWFLLHILLSIGSHCIRGFIPLNLVSCHIGLWIYCEQSIFTTISLTTDKFVDKVLYVPSWLRIGLLSSPLFFFSCTVYLLNSQSE